LKVLTNKPDQLSPFSRRLRIEIFAGLVFGTLGQATPPLEQYLGPDHLARIRRVMRAPAKLIGGYSQIIPSNWKLYMVSEAGGNHISWSMTQDVAGFAEKTVVLDSRQIDTLLAIPL
jgi:hypothetical protein